MTTFKKGQPVWVIRNDDSKGAVSITKLTVDSCGKKQMHLRHQNDAMARQRFFMKYINNDQFVLSTVYVVADGTPDLEAKAIELAEKIIKAQAEHYVRCLASCDDVHYQRAIRAEIAAMHEARVIYRTKA